MIDRFINWIVGGALNGLANVAYWLCLFTAIGAVLIYICGFRKAAKYTTLSIVIYTVLQAAAGVF